MMYVICRLKYIQFVGHISQSHLKTDLCQALPSMYCTSSIMLGAAAQEAAGQAKKTVNSVFMFITNLRRISKIVDIYEEDI